MLLVCVTEVRVFSFNCSVGIVHVCNFVLDVTCIGMYDSSVSSDLLYVEVS